jgi:hypothetical protein
MLPHVPSILIRKAISPALTANFHVFRTYAKSTHNSIFFNTSIFIGLKVLYFPHFQNYPRGPVYC